MWQGAGGKDRGPLEVVLFRGLVPSPGQPCLPEPTHGPGRLHDQHHRHFQTGPCFPCPCGNAVTLGLLPPLAGRANISSGRFRDIEEMRSNGPVCLEISSIPSSWFNRPNMENRGESGAEVEPGRAPVFRELGGWRLAAGRPGLGPVTPGPKREATCRLPQS
jgi:hypothetical protein